MCRRKVLLQVCFHFLIVNMWYIFYFCLPFSAVPDRGRVVKPSTHTGKVHILISKGDARRIPISLICPVAGHVIRFAAVFPRIWGSRPGAVYVPPPTGTPLTSIERRKIPTWGFHRILPQLGSELLQLLQVVGSSLGVSTTTTTFILT
jgi:hypothetical protein